MWWGGHNRALLVMGLSLAGRFARWTERIAPDEEVILFPALAAQINATHWRVPIHGWIYEPEHDDRKRKAFLALLRAALQLKKGDAESDCFTRRAQWFLVDNERWRSPRVEICGQTYRVPVSSKNGHFQGVVELTTDDPTPTNDPVRLLPMTTRADDGRAFQALVHLVPPEGGVSVISDIDDTVKISNVTRKRELLRNTFLKEFQPVPGMAALYQSWHQHLNATFHFVSSSPYQLYMDLEDFRQRNGFPPATYDLKTIRPKDKTLLLKLLADPLKSKNATIASVFDRFPKRQFILVGDSGEKDPEVYGQLARRYPSQVVAIYIRRVVGVAPARSDNGNDDDNEKATTEAFAERMYRAFQGVPSSRWTVFETTDDIHTDQELERIRNELLSLRESGSATILPTAL